MRARGANRGGPNRGGRGGYGGPGRGGRGGASRTPHNLPYKAAAAGTSKVLELLKFAPQTTSFLYQKFGPQNAGGGGSQAKFIFNGPNNDQNKKEEEFLKELGIRTEFLGCSWDISYLMVCISFFLFYEKTGTVSLHVQK